MGKTLGMISVVAMLVSGAWAASHGEIVYSFAGLGDGGDPATSLTFDAKGNAYGTTVNGGSAGGFGTVFELKRVVGGKFQESVLYSFSGGADGKNPYGGVVFDAAGNLYGVTVAGGTGGFCSGDGCGVVFQLINNGGSWSEKVLYNFTGGNDGFGPGGGVVFDAAGNLYGTTPDGGKFGVGVVYELSPQTGKFTVIHAFTGGNDGAVGSLGSLLLAPDGNFYGVSELGGANGAGTVFRLSPIVGGTWKFTSIYSFGGQPDAGFPYGGLITDGKGNFYGTTYYGGANGVGAVYRLDLTKKKESVIYDFQEGNDGGYPTSTLVFDAVGNMWGTTSMGGFAACDCGTVFELSPVRGGDAWSETILHRFKEKPDGGYPYYGLTADPHGNLFSTTASGGADEAGIVFGFKP